MSQQILLACALISAILGASWALIKATIFAWKTLRKVGRLADDLIGEPAEGMRPARPGVLDRLERIEQRLDRIDELDARLAAIEERFRPEAPVPMS